MHPIDMLSPVTFFLCLVLLHLFCTSSFPQVYIDGEFYGGCDIMIGVCAHVCAYAYVCMCCCHCQVSQSTCTQQQCHGVRPAHHWAV
jgi:hypothetical protein